MIMQPLTPAGPGDPPFAVENCNENMDSLIKLLKDAGGTVVQSDLKVCTCCHVWSIGLSLCVGCPSPTWYPTQETPGFAVLALVSSAKVASLMHHCCTASAMLGRTYLQVRLGYQGKAGHRAFRRLRTTLEEEGYIQEVVGTVGADTKKPVVCIKCAMRCLGSHICKPCLTVMICPKEPWSGYLRHTCNDMHVTSLLPASPFMHCLQAAQGAGCSWRCGSCSCG